MRLGSAPLWCFAENEELAYALRLRTSAWLKTVLRASALVMAAVTIAAVASHSPAVWWIYASFSSVLVVAILLDGAQRQREAGIVLSLGFWGAATMAVFFLGGVRSPGSYVYLPIVITAGLFWSWRAAAGLTVASLSAVVLAAWLDDLDLLPLPLHPLTAARLVQIFAGSLTMTAVLVGIALHTIRGALQDVRRHALRADEVLLAVPDVLVVLDRLGMVLAVGPAMSERLGYEPAELVGKHVSRVGLFGNDSRAAIDDLWLRGMAAGDGGRELALRRKDGTLAWGDLRLQTVPRSNGGSRRRIIVYDVTRRHLAEADRAELEMRVERGRRLETMGLRAGGVAHDFNNLLTVILSLGSLLDTQLPEGSPARRLLVEINESAVRAAQLARELLNEKPASSAVIVDVHHELAALEPTLSRMVGGSIKLSLCMRGRSSLAGIERADLQRIITNLVINARDAMTFGGEIVIAAGPTLSSANDGTAATRRMIELSVTDTGMGMDNNVRQRIFEPFYTTKGDAGTGLGLAAVHSIVARVGGRIEVESERGRGTKICVLLPEADRGNLIPWPSTADGTRPV